MCFDNTESEPRTQTLQFQSHLTRQDGLVLCVIETVVLTDTMTKRLSHLGHQGSVSGPCES